MIERITVAGCTSYGPSGGELQGLRAVNVVYGANGAGKTTISRVVANPTAFLGCQVIWLNHHPLEAFVYNRDFVRDNFSETGKLKGIFTLGKQDIGIQAQIAQAKSESGDFLEEIAKLRKILEGSAGNVGKLAELAKVEDSFRDECWDLKTKHTNKLKDALRGFLNDKKAFKKKLEEECKKQPARPILSLAALEQRAVSLFGETPVTESPFPVVEDTTFLEWEEEPVLGRRILGKTDVDIAALIQKWGNSDWVRQGVPYLEASDGVCPFCQQNVTTDLTESLEEYFDQSFLKDTATLAGLEAGYKLEGERIQLRLELLAGGDARFIDVTKMKSEKAVFDARFAANLQRIATKRKEPSQLIVLESLKEVLQEIKGLVTAGNQSIATHNEMVANLTKERTLLTEDVWAFLAHSEMKNGYAGFCDKKAAAQKIVDTIEGKITKARTDREEREATIRQLEKSVTSIQPTVNEINRLLNGFGFRNFSIEGTKENFYRLCRNDGTDAQETLSEGERSFLTFLYFFHLLKGSVTEAGLNTDRIVVFDDPVSSLDSDVLFIVSSLIKQTMEEARAKTGTIKQVFVLTHNVYFYKEVVFDGNRSGMDAMKHETFWTVRKINDVSTVKQHTSVPIKTSYELLWSPLREPNLIDQSLQNSMRRVLEHYFRVLGGVSFDKILAHFEGEEKVVCGSLLSWVHDGSHSVPDDLFHTLDESAMARYLAVFQKVFTKMGHTNHYNMMMGLPYTIIAEA